MPLILTLVFSLFCSAIPAVSQPVITVIKSDVNGLLVDFELSPAIAHSAEGYARIKTPGLARIDSTHLPFLARLVAAPPGARLIIEVQKKAYVDFSDILLPDVQAAQSKKRAESEYIGRLRGVEAHALRFFPYEYSAETQVLRAYTRVRLQVRFIGGRRAKNAAHSRHLAQGHFLNGEQASSFYAPVNAVKKQVNNWYDPDGDWVKILIDEDGVYRINRAWLERFVEVDAIDLRTLRLFRDGQEQPLYIKGGQDLSFDEGDAVIFHGLFRRGERDFENLYGRRNTYWLTWGGAEGMRYSERSGAPVNNYPQTASFWTTAHFERDLKFDALTESPDDERDHWFWTLNNKPLTATKPDVPSAAEFPGDLLAPDLDRDYQARIRVALHGASDLGHHTVLKLNARQVLNDSIWGGKDAGMVEFLAEAEVASSDLKDGRNRILLQVFADQEKFDLMWFNWFEVDYFRNYAAHNGYLDATHPVSDGHRIEVENFAHAEVEVFDLNSHTRLTDFVVDGADSVYTLLFEDVIASEARYIIADSLAMKTPLGIAEETSDLRNNAGGEYLIIAHPLLMDQAERLAEHRRSNGLSVVIASSQDIYDEFNFGHLDAEAIRAFIGYAYHNWPQPIEYALLLGDETWDYRNIIGGGRPTIVPSLYYQSRGRGQAPSDFLFSLVDGDDLLADVSIGRLATSSQSEAEVVINKIIDYDRSPEPGAWRSRAIYLANHHPKNIFSEPSDSLAVRYSEAAGLVSRKIYNPDEGPIPNQTGREFVRALNEGALLLNFSGHGSPGTMQSLFTLSLPDWGYLAQVQNGRRLPLVLALSCLNGLFSNPTLEGLAEVFTNRAEGGAIAYISASAKSFVAQNNLLSDRLYDGVFGASALAFGPALDVAKAQVLAAHSSWVDAALTMQLVGDPAQKLALAATPDYVVSQLDVVAGQVRGHETVQVEAQLNNYGRLSADSLRVMVLAYGAEAALPETLLTALEPPFAGERTLSFAWSVGARRGEYRLELILDQDQLLSELDENNNALSTTITILEPLRAEPVFPAAGAALSLDEVSFEAVVPVDDLSYQCEFSFATSPDFADEQWSPLVTPEQGVAVYRPALVAGKIYFWRVRLHTGAAPGAWSATRSLRTEAGARWSQQGEQLLAGQVRGVELVDGRWSLSTDPLPLRPDSSSREDGFTVRDLEGAGVLVTDGIWLYAKRWFNDASTVYPGKDFFTRIGTGLNETFRSGNFGVLGDSTTAGISATYHSDGYIYNESGKAFELERLSVETGLLDTVAVDDGLLEWKSGRIEDGHSLITSDGQFVYNVSMSTKQGARNAWGVRVFDPDQNWALVREFESPPTETGFTFLWTDGILADGKYIYLIEWQGERRIRMIDALDGSLVDEWQSDQDVTRAITGQYDWVNNKVWLGDLWSSAVFRYGGLGRVSDGEVISPVVGAAVWQSLLVEGEGIEIDVLVPDGEQWVEHATLRNLSVGAQDLNGLDAETYPQIRLRARLSDADAYLSRWSLDFAPRPDLQLVRAEGRASDAGLAISAVVRNVSAEAIGDAVLSLQLGGEQEAVRQVALGRLERGQTQMVFVDSLDLPPQRSRFFAVLNSSQPDANPEDNRVLVPLLIAGRLPLNFTLWPEGRVFLSGDPLLSGQGLLVAAPDIGGQLELRIDGQVVEPDSLIDVFPEPARLLFRPELTPGKHQLEARLLRGDEELGSEHLHLFAGQALRLSNVLPYPHPVRQTASFTYVLSQPAEVAVEIYSVTGRLVRRLEAVKREAGFAQTAWDGRGEGGQQLASGTYLYRIVAYSDGKEVVFRGALAVVR